MEKRRRPTPRTYTVEERAEAVALATKMGPTAAGRQLGIPGGTISCWQTQARRKDGNAPGKPDSAIARVAPQPEVETGAVVPSREKEVSAVEGALPGRTRNRVAKVYTPSERARALELVDKHGISKTSRMLNISRSSLYDWMHRVALAAAGKLLNSPLVGSDEDLIRARDEKILAEWKKHPGLGPSQVKNQLRRAGVKTSVRTVRRVLLENGYVPKRVKRTNLHDQNFEAVRPNHLWHLDFLSRYIHKQQIYVLLIIDDYSRFIVGHFIADAERGEVVINTFEAAVNRYGKPEKAMSDGGSAFYSWSGISRFTRLIEEELEIDHIVVETPEANGKLEALNGNIQKELFDQEKFFNLAQTARRLESWISFYNYRRTHHALGGLLVPADRYMGRADEVLAQIEAGRTPDGVAEPISVAERILDILRVTTHNGKLSVSLMGNQIWPPIN